MGREYSVSAQNLTLDTGNVLLAFQTTASPNAGALIKVRRVVVTQSGTTTLAMIKQLQTASRDTAGTLTMSSVTPANVIRGGPVSALVGNTNVIGGTGRIGVNSTADSGGVYTSHRLFEDFANLNGLLWIPTPEEQPLILPSTVWCVRFSSAPVSLAGWSIVVNYEEVL
jgi:hypothetical protein